MRNKNYKFYLENKSLLNGVSVLLLLMLVGFGCSRFTKTVTNTSTPTTSNTSSTPKVESTPAKTPFTKADASKAEMPSDAELQDISKTTLLDFNDAVQSGDFTNFYSKIARPWQRQTTADKLKETFRVFIDKDIDIGGISSRDASFSPSPVIEREIGYKTLKLQGRYSTSPNPTKFVLHYIPEGKDWKLSRIEVDTTP